MFPVPAEQDRFFDARAVHVAQELVDVGPTLERALAGRVHASGPPRLAVRRTPAARVGGDLRRVQVDVAIGDAHSIAENSGNAEADARKRNVIVSATGRRFQLARFRYAHEHCHQTFVSDHLRPYPVGFRDVRGQPSSPAAAKPAAQNRMFVAPSSTKVALGKVALSVSPLGKQGGYYVGTYRLKVTPYFFKNEMGTLTLGNGDDLFGKLAAGMTVPFTGKATSGKDGMVKKVNGSATPSGSGQGAVSFTVVTENGPMTFNTSYKLGQ